MGLRISNNLNFALTSLCGRTAPTKSQRQIRDRPTALSVFYHQSRLCPDSDHVIIMTVHRRWAMRWLTKPLLFGLGCLYPIGLRAGPAPQWVAFKESLSEARYAERQTVVCLVRVAGDAALQQAFTAILTVRNPNRPGSESTTFAYFSAGSALGFCTLSLPDARAGEFQWVTVLEIVENSQTLGFARKRHFVRILGHSEVVAGALINAVVFSGADTPENAVDAGGTQARVSGGIVALGGAILAPVSCPAALTPRVEYWSGLWTPPLSPQALVVQFNPWTTTTAP